MPQVLTWKGPPHPAAPLPGHFLRPATKNAFSGAFAHLFYSAIIPASSLARCDILFHPAPR